MRTTKPKRRRKKQSSSFHYLFLGCLICILLAVGYELIKAPVSRSIANVFNSKTKLVEAPPITSDLLDPNPYSRPQTALENVTGIVVHYVANPGSTAAQNRNYFNGLKDSHATYASSHFVVDLDGTIVQAVPLDEIAYASNTRNSDTISIECCHYDETGKFSDATYDSLVKLSAWLCGKYNLKEDDIIRHYDVTGKLCPLYYVEHEDEWEQFKDDVFDYIKKNGTSS